jgi:hypothetical protein
MTGLLPLASLILSVTAATQVWQRSALDISLRLQAGFLDVFAAMPFDYASRPLTEWSDEQRTAAFRYWHHAHTEWRVTKGSWDPVLRRLWTKYLGSATVSGYSHPALRTSLDQMIRADPILAKRWNGFLSDLSNLLIRNGLPPIINSSNASNTSEITSQ